MRSLVFYQLIAAVTIIITSSPAQIFCLESGAYSLVEEPLLDPRSGVLTLYKVVPYDDNDESSARSKRQASGIVPSEEPTTKGTTKDKKLLKETKESSGFTNTTTTSTTTMKSIVLNVVPIATVTNSSSTTAVANKTGTILSTTPAPPGQTKGKPVVQVATNSTDLEDMFPSYPLEYEYPKNYTTKNDTHKYYNSSYYKHGEFLWVELDDHSDTVKHELLSSAHRRAATVQLKFDFPFYGHVIQNVTMATGGFVYLGEQVHAWLAATQYVAPLMANFHSTYDNATVRYLSNATQFTVEWDHVHIHGEDYDSGAFTFQASLYVNGTIVFAYKDVPVQVKELNDTHHPVKVGLSDAYITDKTLLFVKSRTIFEYDRIDVKDYEITNGSAIIFSPLETCLSLKTCQECTSKNIGFKCTWCAKANRCSDGTDRHRQDWLVKSCTYSNFESAVQCFMGTTSTSKPGGDTYHNFGHDDGHDDHHWSQRGSVEVNLDNRVSDDHYHDHHDANPEKVKHASSGGGGMSAGGVMGLLFFFMVLFGGGGWIFYAYYYPHSPSGQLLIRFRPSQWGAFRRGEARYTAASIHM